MTLLPSILKIQTQIKEFKAKFINIVSKRGVDINSTTPMLQYPEKVIAAMDNAVSYLSVLVDNVAGDEEAYLKMVNRLTSISNSCDEIIGKTNTSNTYNEYELDRLDELEQITIEITGE